MNIFVLDRNPRKAAAYHCDRHVVKMILETAQLLSTCHWLADPKKKKPIYKPTHPNHPCSLWLRESIANYRWLVALGLALLNEYTLRYQKIHKSTKVLKWLSEHEPPLPQIELTSFALAMPEKYRTKNPIRAYRAYYRGEKAGFATWKTKTPHWWKQKG